MWLSRAKYEIKLTAAVSNPLEDRQRSLADLRRFIASVAISYGMSAVTYRTGRLLIDLPFESIAHCQLSLSFPSPQTVTPCPQSLPHLLPIPTLPPSLTLRWRPTIVRLSNTSPSIRSFPGFNLVIPPKPSSPFFESKPQTPINPRIATDPTTDSQN